MQKMFGLNLTSGSEGSVRKWLIFYSLYSMVTLKIRPRLLKSNQLFHLSHK